MQGQKMGAIGRPGEDPQKREGGSANKEQPCRGQTRKVGGGRGGEIKEN